MLGRDREADGETRSPTASCSGFEPQNAPCTLVWTLSLDFLIRKWGDGMGNCTSWRPQVSCVRGSHRQGAQLMGAIRSQLWTGEAYPPISGGWDQGFSCPVLSHQPLPPPPTPLDFSLLEKPLPIPGCSGEKSVHRYVSFREWRV